MPDTVRIVDRRRVTAAGAARPSRPSSRRFAVPHRRVLNMVEDVWRHIDVHLDRGLRTRLLQPAISWTHIYGLALSARQTHDAIALLVAERNRPKTLPLQGAILVRSLLENLGNVMALTSRPTSMKWFLADGYRRQFEYLRTQRAIFGGGPEWEQWLSDVQLTLDIDALSIGLGKRRRRNPSKTIPEWPSPYWLTRPRKVKGRKSPLPVLLSGNRAKLFVEVYRFWYSQLSTFSHQRCAAARMALFAHNPDTHWDPGLLESNVTLEALMFFTCTMSELEAAAKMPPSVDLRALWSLLWDADEEAKRLVDIRYRRLLHLPKFQGKR